jgi:CheY-like chemotaxis protein
VYSAASADQALEQIHKHGDIAIVLSDYRMHGDNSMNTLLQLQALTPQHLHIIIITAEQLPASEANIQQHGFALLHKPLRPAKLRKLLQNLTAANASTQSSA